MTPRVVKNGKAISSTVKAADVRTSQRSRSRRDAFPELFDAIEPRAGARRVRCSIIAEARLEFLEKLTLALAEFYRRFDDDSANQIADMSVTHVPHTLATQAERFARLRFGGNADRRVAAERGHQHLSAERGLRETDRHFAEKIVAFALENLMFAYVNFHVKIAGRRARGACLTFTRQANAVAAVHTCGDFHG